jgi:hypothetical protein
MIYKEMHEHENLTTDFGGDGEPDRERDNLPSASLDRDSFPSERGASVSHSGNVF